MDQYHRPIDSMRLFWPNRKVRYTCKMARHNPRDEFRQNRGIVKGLALDRFAGPDGLMLLPLAKE